MNDSPLHQFGLHLLQSHKIDFKKNDKAFVNHFFVHWTCIRRSSRHPTLHRECAKFLSVMGATTHMKGQNNTEHVAKLVSYLRTEYLLSALEISNSNTKIGASILREEMPL